jgi:hypothetical protein
MKLILDDVREVGPSLWIARIPPHELNRQLGNISQSKGNRSIFLVTSPLYDRERSTLQFDPNDVDLLNVGTSGETLIVGRERDHNEQDTKPIRSDAFGLGDTDFLRLSHRLVPELTDVAEELLKAVRQRFPGDLQRLIKKPRKFVNTPDNFWTILIQPRDRSFYITIRGKPENYVSNVFTLKTEMASYSRFYLKQKSEVSEALRLITTAKTRGLRLRHS